MSSARTPKSARYGTKFDIGCDTCKVGIRLQKDGVAIHDLKPEDEAI